MQHTRRVIKPQDLDLYKQINDVVQYLIEENRTADDLCPACLVAIDMLEHIQYGMSQPIFETDNGVVMCDYDADERDNAIVYVDPIDADEYAPDETDQDDQIEDSQPAEDCPCNRCGRVVKY